LSWAKAQQGEIKLHAKTLLLVDVMADVFAEVTDQARMKGVVLRLDIPGELYVKADSNMLMITMRNLICNAVKFSNSGSRVFVTAKENLSTGKVFLEVRDEGIGMDEEQIADILSGIKSTSRYGTDNEKGSGLGLVLCRELIKMHGSELQIESRPGHGSVFRFALQSAGTEVTLQKITHKQSFVN
jgi:signal transduction histidine kinase